MENLGKEIEDVMKSVLGDLKKMTKDYAPVFVVLAIGIYLWRKLR